MRGSRGPTMTLPPGATRGHARAPARDTARHGSIARLPRPLCRRSHWGRYHTDRHPGDAAQYTAICPAPRPVPSVVAAMLWQEREAERLALELRMRTVDSDDIPVGVEDNL